MAEGSQTSNLQKTRLGGVVHNRNDLLPGNVVSWRFQPPANDQSVALVVGDATATHFTVIGYNLEKTPVNVTMTGWNIEPGQWDITQGIDTNNDNVADQAITSRTAAFEASGDLELTFPPHATTVLTLKLKTPGTAYGKRPDLGIAREDVFIQGSAIGITVHSIGAVDSPAATLNLLDKAGKVVASAPIPPLPAPLDLFPKTANITLIMPAGMSLDGLPAWSSSPGPPFRKSPPATIACFWASPHGLPFRENLRRIRRTHPPRAIMIRSIGGTFMALSTERAVLAGGCFWGMQDLIRRLPGVISTRVGYTGGDVKNATYRNHGTHAEAIEIIFDPAKTILPQYAGILFPDPRSPPRSTARAMTVAPATVRLSFIRRKNSSASRRKPSPMSMPPASGPEKQSQRFPRPAISGRPRRRIRTISSTFPKATPAILSAPTGNFPTNFATIGAVRAGT